MHAYRYADWTIATSTTLPELAVAGASDHQLTFVQGRRLTPGPTPRDRFHHWTAPNGNIYLSFRRLVGGYSLQFNGLAVFEVSADLRTVRCAPAPGVAARSIRHLFLDTVMPLVLSVAAKTVLHASAVEHKGEAILFVGASGRGKSTLASTLAVDDGAVLADDAVIVEAGAGRFHARPTYQSLRLRPDSARALLARRRRSDGGRHPAVANRFVDRVRLPIKRIYFVERRGRRRRSPVVIEPIHSIRAVLRLVEHTFNLDIACRNGLERQFETLTQLAERGLCYRLEIVRDFKLLPAVRQAIERHASNQVRSGLA
jgi:ABC-type iron transport system FetAB ATPase subunit